MGVVMCLFVWWEGHGDLDRLLGVLLLLLGHVSSSPPPFPTFATLGVLASPLSDMIHSRSINTVSQSLLAVECSFFSSSSFVLSQGPGSQGLFWDTGPWDPGTLVPSLRIVVRRVVRLVEEVENGVGGGGGDWCDGGYVAPVGRVEVVKMRPERELCCVRVCPVRVQPPDVLRPLLRVQHLHEERRVRRVALHVFEVQEVLAALRHHLQVGQQVQKLGEFVRDVGVAVDAVVEDDLVDLLVALLHVAAIAETPNVRI